MIKRKAIRLSNQAILLIGLPVLIAVGFFMIWYATPNGMGLVNDSVGYITGARNIIAGNGYSRTTGNYSTVPITNYPPLFSIVLALLGLAGGDVIHISWWLNVLLFCANGALMGWAAFKMTGFSWLGLLAGSLFILSAPFLRTHAFAMSEPIYLFLSFTMMLALANYFEKRRWPWMALSGLLAGLAYLARYVGAGLFLTAALTILLFLDTWRKRIVSGLIFLAAGLPSVMAWTIRNLLVAENAANRVFLWHPISYEKIREGVINFWGWLLPEYGRLIENHIILWAGVFVIFFLVLTVGCLVTWRRLIRHGKEKRDPAFYTAWIFVAQGLVYFILLVFTMSFVDASPIFEDRILSPFLIAVLPAIILVLKWFWQWKTWFYRTAVIVSACTLFLFMIEDDVDFFTEFHRDGQGFASDGWRDSGTIQAVSGLPSSSTLYSNKMTALYLLAEHPAYILPSATNPATGQPREGYEEDVAMIREQVLGGQSYMVIFYYRDMLDDPEQAEWINDLSEGLPVYLETNDGIIFGKN